MNHFQSVCRWRETQKRLHVMQEVSSESDTDESIFGVQLLGAISSGHKVLTVPLTFSSEPGEISIQCQIDTGATCNVMSFDTLCDVKQTKKPHMKKSSARLKLYDDSVINVKGECDLTCHYKGVQRNLNFKIVDSSQPPLLSQQTCTKMGLISVHVDSAVNSMQHDTVPLTEGDIVSEFSDVFQGLGCLAGEYHIDIDPAVRRCRMHHVVFRLP